MAREIELLPDHYDFKRVFRAEADDCRIVEQSRSRVSDYGSAALCKPSDGTPKEDSSDGTTKEDKEWSIDAAWLIDGSEP